MNHASASASIKKACVISTGDELVLGQTVDTNTAWLSQQLIALGYDVVHHATVGDSQSMIADALRQAASYGQLIVVSGGLGPTADDLTRHALADVMGVSLELHEPSVRFIEDFFSKLGRVMPEGNRIQAMFPASARVLPNDNGTAPGIDADLPAKSPDGTTARVFVLPGVPKEMKLMFDQYVKPKLLQAQAGATGPGAILSRTVHTFGAGESTVAEKLGSLMDRTRNPSVGTTVSHGVVSLRINSRGASHKEALLQLEQTDKLCRAELGDLVYGQNEQTLASVVAELLKKQNKTVATAESCTGGLLAKYLTDIPGSSAYFTHGWVTYSNDAKTQLLGVLADTLLSYGAVSEQTVREMALSAIRLSKAHYALSISGIAGPDGGSDAKPVGTVCICLADQTGSVKAQTLKLPGDREMIRDRAAKWALNLLRLKLKAL